MLIIIRRKIKRKRIHGLILKHYKDTHTYPPTHTYIQHVYTTAQQQQSGTNWNYDDEMKDGESSLYPIAP